MTETIPIDDKQIAAAPRGGTSRPAALVAVAVAVVAAAVGLFVLLYAIGVHAFAPDSDGATVALQGQVMLHGNVLLHRWSLSLDSFWTVDALWYLVAVLFYGLHPALLHAVPVLIVVAVIAVGVVMAIEERRGAAAVAAAGDRCGPPRPAGRGSRTLHAPRAAPCRNGAVVSGGVSWFEAGQIRLGLRGCRRLPGGGAPRRPSDGGARGRADPSRRRCRHGQEPRLRAGLPEVAAAISSVVLAELVRLIARAIGTFHIARANPIAKLSQMIHNVKQGIHEGVSMMGVGSAYYGLGADPRGLSYVRVLAVLVVFGAVASAAIALVWGFVRGRPSVVGRSSEAAWRLDDLLLFGALGSFAAFIVLAASNNPAYGRYLTAGIIFGSILSGRVVGRLVQDLRWRSVGRLAAVVGLAAAACYAAGVGLNLATPAPPSRAAALARWLDLHDLHDGIGDYWASSIVTVESSGTVRVRPVFAPDGDQLVGYDRNSSLDWFNESFQFLVFRLGNTWGDVNWLTAVNTFGRPCEHLHRSRGLSGDAVGQAASRGAGCLVPLSSGGQLRLVQATVGYEPHHRDRGVQRHRRCTG